MTFGQLAAAVDDAFGRWELAHLPTVEFADGLLLIGPGEAWDDPPQGRPVERLDRIKLSRLALGEQFAYTLDLGDDWTHLCTVGDQRIDPYEALGDRPAAYWGWGACQTSTDAGSTRTTARRPCPRTRAGPTCR